MVEKETNGYVKWQIFVWVVGIFTSLLLGLFAFSSSTASDIQNTKVDVAVLKEQYKNIDKNLIEIKDLLKEN